MNTKIIFRHVISLSAGLWLIPMSAGADFIIELRSGRQITVEQYAEDGQKIVIQTAQGTIEFRKDDVTQITEVADNQGLRAPLEEALTRPVTPPALAPVVPEERPGQAGAAEAGTASEAGQDDETKKETLSAAQIAQIDEQYQKVSQTYKDLWAKHKQQVRAGASEAEVAENRQRLLALDKERRLMKNKVRKQAKQEDFPDWVR